MTGDGVNDAPSLKAACIGIALGSGSDITIEAADKVLLESFSVVVEAVQYGRVVFDNLQKTIAHLLPAEVLGSFYKCHLGPPSNSVLILTIIICCFTDCAAATAPAYEAREADVFLRHPCKPKVDLLVDWRLILQAYGFVGILEAVSSLTISHWYFQRKRIPFWASWFQYGVLPNNIDPDHATARLNEASSIYFVTLVATQ